MRRQRFETVVLLTAAAFTALVAVVTAAAVLVLT